MSSLGPGEQKRSLAELLASWPKRSKKTAENGRSPQEAALYLLSCHQDPNDFLSEVAASPCKKAIFTESPESSEKAEVPAYKGTFVASALRDQARHLGLPVGVVSARAAVSNIKQICQVSADCARGAVLSRDQRESLTRLLKTLKRLLEENCFCRSLFSKEFWEQQRHPVLEAVWYLHHEDIIRMEDMLESCKDSSSAVDWFCEEMRSLCLHMEESSHVEHLQQMASDIFIALVGNAFRPSTDPGKRPEHLKIAEIALRILDRMLSWLLDAVSEDKKEEQSCKSRIERHWLLAFDVPQYRTRLISESIERFYSHTLTQVLTYKPQLRVSDAIRLQGTWTFVKTCPLLTDLHRKLFVVLDAARLTAHIQLVLESQEVNWHHVLTCVSSLVICQAEAQRLLKNLLSHLMAQAFTHHQQEGLLAAFLIARQAALEGPIAFMSYTEWFKITYGSASSYHGTSKKSLIFLLKLLSDLVPFEAAQYLKVHILHPPFVQTKYRPLLMEYISLAKTRLADLKVSIEDMGLYEDVSADPDKKQSQAQQDVEKAVQIFQTTGKIPASVMEASIFRRAYFTSRFLPALLAPRVLPPVPDSHMLLIDALKRAEKIPANPYGVYTDACEQEKIQRLEGRKMMMDVSLHEEPLLKLKSALWDLRPLVADSSRYSDVSSQLALISDRLSAVVRNVSAEDASELSFHAPGAVPQSEDQAVADLLLTCFCHCVMAASRTNPPDRQGPWPSLYLKMMCGHRTAVTAVLSRLLQLLCDQAPLLKDTHVVGLAVFAIHLHECQTSLPIPNGEEHPLEKFWESLLNPKGSNTMLVCLRFCVSATCYAFCRFSLLCHDAPSGCIPPVFLCKLQHLVPRLIQEARGEGIREEEMDTPLIWRALSLPSPAWKESALTLWHQSLFQELLRQESSNLSFRDWLLWEMASHSDKDALCDTDRQDYQRWAVNQVYLPRPSSSGGCDGDSQRACTVIVNAVLDFSIRRWYILPASQEAREAMDGTEKARLGSQEDLSRPHSRTGLADVLCRLQETVCDLLIAGHQPSERVSINPLIFQIFHERLAASKSNSELSARLTRQGELGTCCRILLGLPPLLLITVRSDGGSATLQPEDFFQFVNEELKNIGPHGCALPYNITAHFFKAVLTSSSQCADPAEAVNTLLLDSRSSCPVILSSAALWWLQIRPVLRCQWDCLFGGALPRQLEIMEEMQTAVDSCLSLGSPLHLAGPSWLLAAFMHFTIQRKRFSRKTFPECLGSTSAKATPLLLPILFFSIMDLIPALLKEGAGCKTAQNCLQIIHCLEERGDPWVRLFQPTEKKEPVTSLHMTASEEFIKLLPFAFYSLVPSLQIGRVVQQQRFLEVAVVMYVQLVQLFLDGNPTAVSSLQSVCVNYHDVIQRGRTFLVNVIPKCPKTNSGLNTQILNSCDECDPELAAKLRFLQEPHDYDDLYMELELF